MGDWWKWAVSPVWGAADSGFFDSKEVQADVMQTPEQQQLQSQLYKYLSGNLSNYTPGASYGGQYTAGATPYEQTGLNILGSQLQNPMYGQLQGAGAQQLMSTLQGNYDPFVSKAYAPLREQAMLEQQSAIDDSRRGAAARGSFFNEGAIRDENDIRTNTTNYLNTLLSGLYGQERQRQYSAAPTAMQYGDPTKLVQASQQYGSLNRLLDQNTLSQMYNDYLRGRGEQSQLPGQAQQFTGQNLYGFKNYETASPFESIMGVIGPVIGAAIGGMTGNPAAATGAVSSLGKGTQRYNGGPVQQGDYSPFSWR